MSISAPIVKLVRDQREWEDREWFPPGPQLAICLSGGKERLADLTDDELLQVAKAARRQTSWAQARELAAIAELTRRRTADEDAGDPDYRILSAHESVTEEVAAALTVTGNTAATLVHLAERLTGPLTETGTALEAGHLDLAKARVICDLTDQLPERTAARVEEAALQKAPAQTTGQLRRRIRRILQRLAPEAVEERKREAVRQRRLELWDTPSGTSDLALCDLPPEDAHAIYNRITAAAHGIEAEGDVRPLNTIRADLATHLLQGAELPSAVHTLLTAPPDPEPARTASSDAEPDMATSARDHTRMAANEREAELVARVFNGLRLPDGLRPFPAAPDRHHARTASKGPANDLTTCLPIGPHLPDTVNGRPAPPPGPGHAPAPRTRTEPDAAPPARDHVSTTADETEADSMARVLHKLPLPDGARALPPTPSDSEHASATSDETRADPRSTQAPAPAEEVSCDVHSSAASNRVHDRTAPRGLSTTRNTGTAPDDLGGEADPAADRVLGLLADIVDRRLERVRRCTHPTELPAAIGRAAQRLQHQLTETREAACRGDGEAHGHPGYRPPAALRREVEARHATCVFPTCNQPSHRCDLDHTIPWRPGTTCRCNLAPLCRRHHRLKQSPGWKLHQLWPGLLLWTTPSGAWHIIRPYCR